MIIDIKTSIFNCKSTSCTSRVTRVLLFLLTTSLTNIFSQSPNIGIPPIISYDRYTYEGGTQSWEVANLQNGNMVFANNEGLLEFNGRSWKKYSLPQKTICRSLSISKHFKIYVGGQDEVGYFYPDSLGNLKFKSIKERIVKNHRSFSDVWEIVENENTIYFRSDDKIYIDNKIDSIYCITGYQKITTLKTCLNRVFFWVQDSGLYELIENKPVQLPVSSAIKSLAVTDIVAFKNDTLLISTFKDGLFKLTKNEIIAVENNYTPFLKNNRLQHVVKTKINQFIISTERDGIVITDENLNAIYHINKSVGLQHNTINGVGEDQAGGLWVATANGIDQILMTQGVEFFYPDGVNQNSIYDIIEYAGYFYFATSNGVYAIIKKDRYNPFEKKVFKFIENSGGQVWGLDIINKQLFMGHTEGSFIIKNFIAYKISSQTGSWKYSLWKKEKLIVGTYFGIDIYELKGKEINYLKTIENFEESSRIMEIDLYDNIWVSHPYRGVYKIKLKDDLTSDIKKYGHRNGLPSDNLNYVFKVNDEIVVTGKTGIYTFNYSLDSFVLKNEWANYIDQNVNVSRIFESTDNHFLYTSDDHIGRFIHSSKIGSEQVFHQQWKSNSEKLVNGFEYIYPINDNSFFIATDKGVILQELNQTIKNNSLTLHFNQIKVLKDSSYLLFGGHENPVQVLPKLKPFNNSILFEYSTNYLNDDISVQYSYKLIGEDKIWSEWSSENTKTFSNLKKGKYDFLLRAKNAAKDSENILSYKFEISPYWYETSFAYFIYLLLFIAFLYGLIYFFKKKYTKETIILKEEQKESKDEIERLKNEQLLTQLDFRNKELASSTMHLVQKNETITKIKQEVDLLNTMIKEPKLKKEFRKLIGLINDDERLEDEWENFAIYFDKVHTNFLQRITKEYPQLTSKDLKLAAYLRMNLSTKEIAPLLNISIRGVEISRYRLRKKMGMEVDVNLNEYMMQY